MKTMLIRRPTVEDVIELETFFRTVITDTFQREGIGDLVEDMEDEMKAKINYLNRDIRSHGKDRYFLLAMNNKKIIGTIEYGPASELINSCTDHALKELMEVGTIFVHPNYQRQGVGNRLLKEMYITLKNKGIGEFCLDSGYQQAQTIWKKKFGEPDYVIKDYWGDGFHHMIWRINVHDYLP
ncbi:GNAT family N-acetyltransferase [Bacillus salitolerans]|uniref:GNAT family N-acetyltransferase n=1 Tax=Bacillus salitolerans TaxID=1437434 RepID=A0ABW4LZN4_9BACI